MPATEPRTVLLQLLPFHLHYAVLHGHRLEHHGELPLDPSSTFPARLHTALASHLTDSRIVAAALPEDRVLQSMPPLDPPLEVNPATLASLATALTPDSSVAPLLAACAGTDGAPPQFVATRAWLLASAPVASLASARARLATWGLAPARLADSTLACLGAIQRARPSAPVLVWDLGFSGSHLVVMAQGGVRTVIPCALSLNRILEIVQQTLGLRYRGAAAKLFAGGNYDYSEAGPRIIDAFLPALRDLVPVGPQRPASLCIPSLGRDQTWFTLALCDALQLTPWTPAWDALGLELGPDWSPRQREELPASAAGLFFLGANEPEKTSAWLPAWSDETLPAASPLAPLTSLAPLATATPRPPAASVARFTPTRPASASRVPLIAAVATITLLGALAATFWPRSDSQLIAAPVAASPVTASPPTPAVPVAPPPAPAPAAVVNAPILVPEPVAEPVAEPVVVLAAEASPAPTPIPPAPAAAVIVAPRPGVVEIVGPSDLRFELRLQPDGAPLHSGVAPATLPDLEPGDYRIRFLRDGWQPRDLAFRLAEGETARPAPEFSTGRVVIRSEPPGARVLFEDNVLGLTPLTLEEHLPAPLALRLSLPGHEEARIGGLVEAGSTLTLAATLDASDRIVPAAELAAMPRPISQASPEPSEPILRTGGTALISLVVDKTGLPANIRVQQTDNNEFARLCVAAVREWRFSPGVAKNGQPASVRVQVPFRVAAR